MLNKVMSRLKLIASNPRWLGFYAQRRVMKPDLRNRLADLVAHRLRPRAEQYHNDEASDEAARRLRTSGIVPLGSLISSNACQLLRQHFTGLEVFDPYRTEWPRFLPLSDARHPDAHIAHHSALDVLRAPGLLALANSPKILGIASAALGCKPTIGYMAVWWSYHTAKGAQQAELFHRDVDDYRFFKLFVYLSDVDDSSGPHIYVSNSSLSNKLTQIRRFADSEVREAFGAGNLLTIQGAAGDAFMEDTFGIHKGQPVAHGTRLLFQVVYSLSPLPYGPSTPIATRGELGLPELDPWVNRVYLR